MLWTQCELRPRRRPRLQPYHSNLLCLSSFVLFIWKYCSESRQETIIWVLNNILSLSRTMARTSGLLEHLVFWDLRTTRTGQWAQDNNEDHLNTCLGLDVWLWGMLGYNWWFGNTIRDIYTETIDFSEISTFQCSALTNLVSSAEINSISQFPVFPFVEDPNDFDYNLLAFRIRWNHLHNSSGTLWVYPEMIISRFAKCYDVHSPDCTDLTTWEKHEPWTNYAKSW